MISAPLPKCPIEVGVVPHWLAVDGVQPAIPENAPLERPRSKRARLAADRAAAQPPAGDTHVADGPPAAEAPAALAAAAAGTEECLPTVAATGAQYQHNQPSQFTNELLSTMFSQLA